MALELDFEVCQDSTCKTLNIKEVTGLYQATYNTTGWNGGAGVTPNVSEVTEKTVTVTDPNGDIFTFTDANWQVGSNFIIDAVDFGNTSGTSLPDGEYTLEVSITVNWDDDNDGGTAKVDTVYTFKKTFFLFCQIKCCVFKKLLEAKTKAEDCDCGEDITFELFMWARLKSLMYAATGCNFSQASTELTKLQSICNQTTDCGCS